MAIICKLNGVYPPGYDSKRSAGIFYFFFLSAQFLVPGSHLSPFYYCSSLGFFLHQTGLITGNHHIAGQSGGQPPPHGGGSDDPQILSSLEPLLLLFSRSDCSFVSWLSLNEENLKTSYGRKWLLISWKEQ